jgi:hypothetical protein
MPLLKGKGNIGSNIKELKESGRGYKQSLAIALKTAGESKEPGSKLKKLGKTFNRPVRKRAAALD